MAIAAAVMLVSMVGDAFAVEPAPAPGFRIKSLDGEVLELDTLRRRGPVLLDFWATWCKPCLQAIPELQNIHADLAPRGLTIVGISADSPRSLAKVRPFVKRMGITYPVTLDEDGGLQQKYQVRALPTTVLVDTTGAIVHVGQGFRPGEGDKLRQRIEALLPAP
jgi:peroxiredoxin